MQDGDGLCALGKVVHQSTKKYAIIPYKKLPDRKSQTAQTYVGEKRMQMNLLPVQTTQAGLNANRTCKVLLNI
ncbi:hypothetical protein M514_00392 [Trichuris suis]|uniref:Uncharacterized protein n=1 Tax=Trichuris suis TaxID=68888 RepID=A0A085NR84_9BILA|nr:hypothetical protein M513_00392 [Trichuris suis]KFD71980.1 hypothetical protein M514_00392 [Trichuris suis]